MHIQNSKVENNPSTKITFGDSRILKWRRQILTRLPDGKTQWQTDKKWQKLLIRIINPLQ